MSRREKRRTPQALGRRASGRGLLLCAALGAAGAACASAPPEKSTSTSPIDELLAQLPPGVDPSWLHFTEPSVKVGDLAPDFELVDARGGGNHRLSALRGRPVLLVFGSYT